MKKILLTLVLAFGITTVPTIGQSAPRYTNTYQRTAASDFAYVHPTLKPLVQNVLRCPPVKKLLTEVSREGLIKVNYVPLGESTANAMWCDEKREIVINASKKRPNGEVMRSIVFEMHNASKQSRFNAIDAQAKRGQLNKMQYVRAIEMLEHENAVQVKKLMDWGIQSGYFPKESEWKIFDDFEDHYKVQQLTGHSQFIAGVYDALNPQGRRQPFQGTIASNLTPSQKDEIMQSLSLKA